MDRLTWRDENARAWFSMKINDGYWGRSSAAISNAVSERLAAYEDTGLSPEQIQTLKTELREIKDNLPPCDSCQHEDELYSDDPDTTADATCWYCKFGPTKGSASSDWPQSRYVPVETGTCVVCKKDGARLALHEDGEEPRYICDDCAAGYEPLDDEP